MLKTRKILIFTIVISLVITTPMLSVYSATPSKDKLIDYMTACAPKDGDPRYGQGGSDPALSNQMIYFFNGHPVEQENGGIAADDYLMANQYGYNYTLMTVTPTAIDKWENYIIEKLDSKKPIKFGVIYSGQQTGNESSLSTEQGGFFRTNFLPKVKIKDSNNNIILHGETIFKEVVFQGLGFRGQGGIGRARGGDILFEIPAGTLKAGGDYKFVIEKGIILRPDGNLDPQPYINKNIEFNFSTIDPPPITNYTVKFFANGGKFKGNKGKISKNIVKNKKLGKVTIPNRKGYQFMGWYTKKTGGKVFTAKSIIKKDMKLYAGWARKATVNTNGSNLHLRSQASTSSKIISKHPHGTKVVILASKGNWHKVKVGNKIGYMHKTYIKKAKTK